MGIAIVSGMAALYFGLPMLALGLLILPLILQLCPRRRFRRQLLHGPQAPTTETLAAQRNKPAQFLGRRGGTASGLWVGLWVFPGT